MKHNLSSYQTSSFTKFVQDIVQQVSPEKIYLLSAGMHKQSSENIFNGRIIESAKSNQFTLLVLPEENEKRSNDTLQDIIENRCSIKSTVTAFVLPVHQFNTWLMHTHPFACKVYHDGLLCYDAGNIPLVIPDEYDAEKMKNKMTGNFSRKFRLATEFLSGAELFIIRKQFPLAAFHLHQAAEQLYTGIIQATTGLRVHTHNLDKLYRYSRHLLAGLEEVFPGNNETEKHLFKLLQKAYIEGRYENDYHIKHEEIAVLNERVLKLLQLCLPLKNSILTIT